MSGWFNIPAVSGIVVEGADPAFPFYDALWDAGPWKGNSACTAPSIPTVSAPLRSVPGVLRFLMSHEPGPGSRPDVNLSAVWALTAIVYGTLPFTLGRRLPFSAQGPLTSGHAVSVILTKGARWLFVQKQPTCGGCIHTVPRAGSRPWDLFCIHEGLHWHIRAAVWSCTEYGQTYRCPLSCLHRGSAPPALRGVYF